jgi:hypothetical protein
MMHTELRGSQSGVGAPARDLQVPYQVQKVFASKDEIHECLKRLEERLRTVLRPVGPSTPEKLAKEKENVVDLAATLRDANEGLQNAIDWIRGITERLEI